MVRKEQDQFIALHVGKNSGRLYKIDVDVDELKADAVALNVHVKVPKRVLDAIRKLAKSKPQKQGNYELAEKVIRSHEEELLKSLVSA